MKREASPPAPVTVPAAYLPTEAKPLACERKRGKIRLNLIVFSSIIGLLSRQVLEQRSGLRVYYRENENLLTCFSMPGEISPQLQIYYEKLLFTNRRRVRRDIHEKHQRARKTPARSSRRRHGAGSTAPWNFYGSRKLDAKNNSRFRSYPIAESQKKLKMHERQQNSVFVYKIENLFLESPRNICESKKAFANFFRSCSVMEETQELFNISMWRWIPVNQWTLPAIPKNFTLTFELLPITRKAR